MGANTNPFTEIDKISPVGARKMAYLCLALDLVDSASDIRADIERYFGSFDPDCKADRSALKDHAKQYLSCRPLAAYIYDSLRAVTEGDMVMDDVREHDLAILEAELRDWGMYGQ